MICVTVTSRLLCSSQRTSSSRGLTPRVIFALDDAEFIAFCCQAKSTARNIIKKKELRMILRGAVEGVVVKDSSARAFCVLRVSFLFAYLDARTIASALSTEKLLTNRFRLKNKSNQTTQQTVKNIKLSQRENSMQRKSVLLGQN